MRHLIAKYVCVYTRVCIEKGSPTILNLIFSIRVYHIIPDLSQFNTVNETNWSDSSVSINVLKGKRSYFCV